jgi:hypothetical protein
MIEKVVTKVGLKESSNTQFDLGRWVKKTPEDRVSTLEYLRQQFYGSAARLQRVARVIQRSSR